MAKQVGKKPVGKASAAKVKLKPQASSKPSKPVAKTSPDRPVATKPSAAKLAPAKTAARKPADSKPTLAKPTEKPGSRVVTAKSAAVPPSATKPAKAGKDGVGKPASVVLAVKPKDDKALTSAVVKGLADGSVKKLKKKSARLSAPKPELPPVRLPPPPVTSDSKMAKNRAGFTSKELEHFRDLLLEKRRELLGDVTSMEREALRSGNTNLSNLPLHMADTGTDNYEQEFTLGLVEKDRQLLREIQVALAKIQDGSYGICEGTSKPISKQRLEVQPWARHSIEYARQMEKPMYRRAY